MTHPLARVSNAIKAASAELFPQSNSIKSAEKFYTSYGGDVPYFASSSRTRLGRDQYSAARAFLTISHIHTAVNLIISSLDNIDWRINEYSLDSEGKQQGKPVAEKGDIVPRHDLQKALRNYKRKHRIGLLKRICASMLLHDETYINLIASNTNTPIGRLNGVEGLDWLNPIGIQVQTSMGAIAGYNYSGMDGSRAQFFRPDEIAYEHGFNSMSDLNGYSNVQAMVDDLNIGLDYKNAILNYLSNGLHMGGIISPDGDTMGLDKKIRELQDNLNNQGKGVRNIGRWHLMPNSMKIENFGTPEFDKMFKPLSNEIRQEVFAKFGIPEAVLGIVDTASFKSGNEVTYRFYQSAVIPYANRIADFVNMQIMHYFADDNDNQRLEYDTSEWDRASEADKLEAEVAQTRATTIPIEYNDLRQQMRLSAVDKLDGMWVVPGIDGLVPEAELGKVWKLKFLVAPSVFNSQELTGNPLPQPVNPDDVVPTPDGAKPPVAVTEADVDETPPDDPLKARKAISADCAFVYIPLANNKQIIDIVKGLKSELTDERIEWQTAPTYHVTLCYAKNMSESASAIAADELHASQVALSGYEIGYFDTPDGKALHIKLEGKSELSDLQASVYEVMNKHASDLSEFSKPDDYNPHITLAYLPDDMEWEARSVQFSALAESLVIGRDDYVPEWTIQAPNKLKAHIDAQHAELDTWRKAALKRVKTVSTYEFKPTVIADTIADGIKSLLASADGNKDMIYDAFEAAKDEVIVYAVYDELLAKNATTYRRSLRSAARGLWSGDLDKRGFINSMSGAIERAFTQAFERGVKSEGYVLSELTDAQRDTLQVRINDEMDYVFKLADDIVAKRKEEGASFKDVRDRVDNWVSRYDSVYDMGVLVGAADKKKVWRVGLDKKHCHDCASLDGKVYKASDWLESGTLPKSPSLACFGMYCGCSFKNTNAPLSDGKPPVL